MNICIAIKTLFLLLLFTAFNTVFAKNIICPPASLVKQAQFFRAVKNPHDEESWNFLSHAFSFNGGVWNVEFGTFLRKANTAQQALKQGQAYFDRSPLLYQHPSPDELPSGIFLCNYMPTGRLYWISALSPPQY